MSHPDAMINASEKTTILHPGAGSFCVQFNVPKNNIENNFLYFLSFNMQCVVLSVNSLQVIAIFNNIMAYFPHMV